MKIWIYCSYVEKCFLYFILLSTNNILPNKSNVNDVLYAVGCLNEILFYRNIRITDRKILCSSNAKRKLYIFFSICLFFIRICIIRSNYIYYVVYLVVRLRHRQFFYNSLRSICKFISVVSVMDIFIFNSGIMIFF